MDQKNLQRLHGKTIKFEKKLADYTGAPYVVCVDSCTSALFLCFLYTKATTIAIPTDTYVGVAMAALLANKKINFLPIKWQGLYKLEPTNIYDSAKRFTKDMYIADSLMCLSFHYKKHLKIGKGGAILTDSPQAYNWFIAARNCGKDINVSMPEQKYYTLGLNMIMHPDLAQKGIKLLKSVKEHNDDLPFEHYGDLSLQMKHLLEQPVFK